VIVQRDTGERESQECSHTATVCRKDILAAPQGLRVAFIGNVPVSRGPRWRPDRARYKLVTGNLLHERVVEACRD